MKRIAISALTGTILFIGGNLAPAIAASCEDAPVSVGSSFEYDGPGRWKFITTKATYLTSKNSRRINFAFKDLEIDAKTSLRDFIEIEVKGSCDKKSSDIDQYVQTGPENQEDALKGLNEIACNISTGNADVSTLIKGAYEVGRCITLGQEIRVTWGIKSDTWNLNPGLKKSKKATISPAVNKDSNTTSYKSNLQEGYSGYQNYSDF